MNYFRSEATRIFSKIKKGSTFLTVHNYVNNYGQVSDFSIVFHVNYLNSVKKSLELLNQRQYSMEDCYGKPYSLTDLYSARMELLESFQMTLDGRHPTTDVYSRIYNSSNVPINGIKLHDKQDILHLNGFIVYNNILLKGNYPLDKRTPKTFAKNDLRYNLPVGKYRQFKLTPGKFHKLVVEGITVREEDVVRQTMNRIK